MYCIAGKGVNRRHRLLAGPQKRPGFASVAGIWFFFMAKKVSWFGRSRQLRKQDFNRVSPPIPSTVCCIAGRDVERRLGEHLAASQERLGVDSVAGAL